MRSRLYRATLEHARGGAIKNRFAYRVYTACLDLDELDELDAKLRLFSLDRPNLFALHGRDYALSDSLTRPSERQESASTLKQRAFELLSAAELRAPAERIELVTQLSVFGFVFNPVSFFLAYAEDGELVAAIAEINNTYDQTYAYVLDERCRVADRRGKTVYATDKDFFVSPFIGDECRYEWLFAQRRVERELSIDMILSRPPMGRFFAVRLRGERRSLSDGSLLRALARFPAMPTQIWLRIHLQALRLRVRGLQYRRPIR